VVGAGRSTRQSRRRCLAAASEAEKATGKTRMALPNRACARAPRTVVQGLARGGTALECLVRSFLHLWRWWGWRIFAPPLWIAESGAAIGVAGAREPGGAAADRSLHGCCLLADRSRCATDIGSGIAGRGQGNALLGTESDDTLAVAALAGIAARVTVGTACAAECAAARRGIATAAPETRSALEFLAAATGHRNALLGAKPRRAPPGATERQNECGHQGGQALAAGTGAREHTAGAVEFALAHDSAAGC
jgi:hypothetical protein